MKRVVRCVLCVCGLMCGAAMILGASEANEAAKGAAKEAVKLESKEAAHNSPSQAAQSPAQEGNAKGCVGHSESSSESSAESNASDSGVSESSSKSTPAKSAKDEELEVFVDEGVIYPLEKNDAAFAVYGEEYALVPLSQGLKIFLAKQDSATHSRALKVADSTLQIESNGEGITFYRSSKKGSNLYSKIAPKRYKLTLEEFSDESVQPQEVRHIYRIQNFNEAILNAKCAIIQRRGFVQDRTRSALVINLDKDINPRLLSQGQRELFLECRMR